MIKVKDVREHNGKLIVEAEVVMIECEPSEAKFFQYNDTTDFVSIKMGHYVKGLGKYFKPILISRTEKVSNGDWGWNKDTNSIVKFDRLEKGELAATLQQGNWFKILALSEHFSPEHLQLIAADKLKKVLVECGDGVQLGYYDTNGEYVPTNRGSSIVKLTPHITLYPQEETQSNHFVEAAEKILDALKLTVGKDVNEFAIPVLVQIIKNSLKQEESNDCILGVGDGSGNHFVRGDYESIEMLQAKLIDREKMYTREEVKEIAVAFGYYLSHMDGDSVVMVDKWFEENVK